MAYRKTRTHHVGASNRPSDWKPAEQIGPIDFDQNARSTAPQLLRFDVDMQVPSNLHTGQGNQDFQPRLPGYTYRQPGSDKMATQLLKKAKVAETTLELAKTQKTETITAPLKDASRTPAQIGDPGSKVSRIKGFKVAPRWNPRNFYEPPHWTQQPLQRDEGETWNSKESENIQGDLKGQDRLMRSVWRPDEITTPRSDEGVRDGDHPLDGIEGKEYYPGRALIDQPAGGPANDFQVRPVHLPDFATIPPENSDPIIRMQRMREVVKQRYAGRPGLMGVFRNCALTKPGHVFPRDLQQVFDQMGIKVSLEEADLLVRAVDKDRKGAANFEEFADLIYGDDVQVGCKSHEVQARHVRHVTKSLVDQLVLNGQKLGKAFCETDPERIYAISKEQFTNAVGTACPHISNQAVEFLWASQFPREKHRDVDNMCVDWRSFMSSIAHFAHDNRPPTPCCIQGRKRQYDLLQRTAPLTGGDISKIGLDLNRPNQNAEDEVRIIADKIVHRSTELASKPREAAFLTPNYVEEVQLKALRVERSLPQLVPKARLQELLRNRHMVGQDELVDLVLKELEQPGSQTALPPQEPIYGRVNRMGDAEVPTLDMRSDKLQTSKPTAELGSKTCGLLRPQDGLVGRAPGMKLVKADLDAWAATQHTNREHEIAVNKLIESTYTPAEMKKAMDVVNDGMNRQRRGLRPPRERPSHAENPRYENYWQARSLMEAIADAITTIENSNGGKLKPSRVFKRLDHDNDGFISLSDLKSACDKYKVPHSTADLHAVFSELDREDRGSVEVGDFLRNFQLFSGSMLDNLQKPIKAVYHEGGVKIGGPLQEEIDKRDRLIAEGKMPGNLPVPDSPGGASLAQNNRSRSAPPSSAGTVKSRASSQMSRAGASIAGSQGSAPMIYAPQVSRILGDNAEGGEARISDVIRQRCAAWKPQKAELYTAVGKTRFGMTCYPDTRHVTDCSSVPLSGSYLPDHDRFKTTNNVFSIYSAPDHNHPQTQDAVRRHATNEFRVERIRQHQKDFTDRCHAAENAATQFDELKIARKAMNQLNYERKCSMACA